MDCVCGAVAVAVGVGRSGNNCVRGKFKDQNRTFYSLQKNKKYYCTFSLGISCCVPRNVLLFYVLHFGVYSTFLKDFALDLTHATHLHFSHIQIFVNCTMFIPSEVSSEIEHRGSRLRTSNFETKIFSHHRSHFIFNKQSASF